MCEIHERWARVKAAPSIPPGSIVYSVANHYEYHCPERPGCETVTYNDEGRVVSRMPTDSDWTRTST